jgi:hypothetical protein
VNGALAGASCGSAGVVFRTAHARVVAARAVVIATRATSESDRASGIADRAAVAGARVIATFYGGDALAAAIRAAGDAIFPDASAAALSVPFRGSFDIAIFHSG